jgi:hypothetical protein
MFYDPGQFTKARVYLLFGKGMYGLTKSYHRFLKQVRRRRIKVRISRRGIEINNREFNNSQKEDI